MKKIINGQEIAKELRLKIGEEVRKFSVQPRLAVIMVGEDPASRIYVRNKAKACEECGILSDQYELAADAAEEDVVRLIKKLNSDPTAHGILIQLPLPSHIEKNKIINALDPAKDADCFHPVNVGKMFLGEEKDIVLPCTPKGCMILLKSACANLEGKRAVVIGRSNIVGKPMAQLLLNENCSVSILHSRTQNIADEIRRGDIVVAAIGKGKFLKKEMLRDGAIVIDVGINRTEDGKICGDVDFDDVIDKCSFITPVPKGVGPMTVACLLQNLLILYKKQLQITCPK
ncbi:MAG: bifunctional 5,10-methylenetetrahydrofolate dehydrogenase/5,10-methenyltetrahydrofolate cyclohydrolase [Rickettsiales bacterium]|jgi:methylenetetrahydrofolate dehydrogenase (NADP+)/methenyltetrahydrofolate cyclohydrolase|nr:bifunctional 5,10-methylenetetrahydrofolate dehydrogenase/5,10-methenyltetrahydrofolate cyclohydrolase [Rickettsiales bacterium]